MKPTCRIWLTCAAIACVAGCSSSSLTPLAIPTAVPPPGSAAAQETPYAGVLHHMQPGLNSARGWRLTNDSGPGSVPLDVTNVAAAANSLNGQKVVALAHTEIQPSGMPVLAVDKLSLYTP